MFKSLARFLSLAACLGLAPFALATPCELERGPTGGYRVSEDCQLLSERFAKVRDDVAMRVGPVFTLELPDLVPVDGNIDLLLGTVDQLVVEVKVANQGPVDAAPFDVQVLVEVYNNGNVVTRETGWVSYPNGLAAGADQRVTFPQPIQHQAQPGDFLVFTFFTDAQQAAAGGKVWEGNEQNNVGEERCRINSIASTDICDDGAIAILAP